MPIGYSTASANQVTDTLNQKYGWTTEHEKSLHQSLIGTSIVVGMAIGAFTAGKVIPYGRRLSMMLANMIGIIGVCLTLIQNFYLLLLGRIIWGFSAGAQGVVSIRMIGEFVPEHMAKYSVSIFTISQSIAGVLAFSSGIVLPKNTDTKAL